GGEPASPDPGARLPRQPDRDRRPPDRRDRHPAGDQYRHRAPQSRHRPGRCGPGAGARRTVRRRLPAPGTFRDVKKLAFRLVDVFTDRPLAGNQLAVVLDAEGVDDGTMQGLAREFNFSETTFVLPATQSGCDVRVRIFTPVYELPMAGHPTVGTAVVLHAEGRIGER